MSYGRGCWTECGEEIVADTQEEVERRAYNAGWKIGHVDGQAHYSCAGCASGLFDARPLRPLDWNGEPPACDALGVGNGQP